jgi:hypothetical protein
MRPHHPPDASTFSRFKLTFIDKLAPFYLKDV